MGYPTMTAKRGAAVKASASHVTQQIDATMPAGLSEISNPFELETRYPEH